MNNPKNWFRYVDENDISNIYYCHPKGHDSLYDVLHIYKNDTDITFDYKQNEVLSEKDFFDRPMETISSVAMKMVFALLADKITNYQ